MARWRCTPGRRVAVAGCWPGRPLVAAGGCGVGHEHGQALPRRGSRRRGVLPAMRTAVTQTWLGIGRYAPSSRHRRCSAGLAAGRRHKWAGAPPSPRCSLGPPLSRPGARGPRAGRGPCRAVGSPTTSRTAPASGSVARVRERTVPLRPDGPTASIPRSAPHHREPDRRVQHGVALVRDVAEAQRRAKKRLPKSVYGALIAGAEKGSTLARQRGGVRRARASPRTSPGCPPSARWPPR